MMANVCCEQAKETDAVKWNPFNQFNDIVAVMFMFRKINLRTKEVIRISFTITINGIIKQKKNLAML